MEGRERPPCTAPSGGMGYTGGHGGARRGERAAVFIITSGGSSAGGSCACGARQVGPYLPRRWRRGGGAGRGVRGSFFLRGFRRGVFKERWNRPRRSFGL